MFFSPEFSLIFRQISSSPRETNRTVRGDGERWNASKNSVVNRVEIDPDTEIRLVRLGAVRLVTEEEAVRYLSKT